MKQSATGEGTIVQRGPQYLVYALIVGVVGYGIENVSVPMVETNATFLFVVVTLPGAYLLSTKSFQMIWWKRLIAVCVIWFAAAWFGMFVLVHFLFNKEDDPAGVYAIIAFLTTIVVCFESIRWISRCVK